VPQSGQGAGSRRPAVDTRVAFIADLVIGVIVASKRS
jgi:hypothetical protein